MHARRNRAKCQNHTPVEDWDEVPDHSVPNEDVAWEQNENSTYNHNQKEN